MLLLKVLQILPEFEMLVKGSVDDEGPDAHDSALLLSSSSVASQGFGRHVTICETFQRHQVR